MICPICNHDGTRLKELLESSRAVNEIRRKEIVQRDAEIAQLREDRAALCERVQYVQDALAKAEQEHGPCHGPDECAAGELERINKELCSQIAGMALQLAAAEQKQRERDAEIARNFVLLYSLSFNPSEVFELARTFIANAILAKPESEG